MGKLRRERQKYHLSQAKSTKDVLATENDESSKKPSSPEPLTLFPVPENIFAGIDISFDNLKQSLKDSDIRSVISKKSLSEGNVISKKGKRKLRHEVFLKKLEATYQARKDAKKYKLKRNPLKAETRLLDSSLDLNIKHADEGASSKKNHVIKQKGIPKAKYRKKVMLQDIALFKSLLANDEYTTDPITSISSHIQSKVYEEFKNST